MRQKIKNKMEEQTEKEIEKEELGEAPETEVKVWGLGLTNNKLDRLIKQNSDIANILRHIENKVESLMDEKAQERLSQIKRRF